MAQKISKFVSFEPKIVKIVLLVTSPKSWIHKSIALNQLLNFNLANFFNFMSLSSYYVALIACCHRGLQLQGTKSMTDRNRPS